MILRDWSVCFIENFLKMPQFNRKHPRGAEKNKEKVRKRKGWWKMYRSPGQICCCSTWYWWAHRGECRFKHPSC